MARGDRQRLGHERTAEERERDREERARRRAIREGRGAPEQPQVPPVEVPPPEDSGHFDQGRRAPGAADGVVSGEIHDPFAGPDTEPHAVVDAENARDLGASAVSEEHAPAADALVPAETEQPAAQEPVWEGDGVEGHRPSADHEPVRTPEAEPWPQHEPAQTLEPGVDPGLQAAIQEPDYEPYADPGPVPDEIPLVEQEMGEATRAAGETAQPPDGHDDACAGLAEAAPAMPATPFAHEPTPAQTADIGEVAAYEAPAAFEPQSASPEPVAPSAPVAPHEPAAASEPAAATESIGEPHGLPAGNIKVSARGTGRPASRMRTSRSPGGRVPPPPGVPGRPGSRGPRRRRGPSSSARLLAVIGLVIVAAVVFILVRSLRHTSAPKPPPAPAVVHVLIPEGLTRLQIADLAARDGLRGDYRLASRSSTVLSPQEYGAPTSTHDLEGFLFPATYDEYPGASVSQLVTDQLTAFKENLPTDIVARARALHRSVYELLIVASMVEREARLSSDRAKVAAVIYNRLHREMPLAIDATLYYAIELKRNIPTYTAELTEAELHMSSAYNTRIHTGLPPTPISNPGVASITAAAHPAAVPYLYYVNGADGCGELAFSSTMAEFERNASAYQAAVAANHGKPPTCKHK